MPAGRSGTTGARTCRVFLPPRAGAPATNLMHLARRELRVELSAALHNAARQAKPVTYKDVVVEAEGVQHRLNIVVRPLPPTEQDPDELFLVVFEELRAAPVAHGTPLDAPTLERHRQLQRDLESTQERLQATIDELENANEALRTSNEQLQSMNEEMHSVQRGAADLAGGAPVGERGAQHPERRAEQEGGRARAALRRPPEPVPEHADRDDLPRPPVPDRALHAGGDGRLPARRRRRGAAALGLRRPVRRPGRARGGDSGCSRRSSPSSAPSASSDGKRSFLMRMHPYRTPSNVIAGVVVSFIDVTKLKEAEAALRQAVAERERAEQALREADRRKDEFLAVLSHELRNPLAPIRSSLHVLEHAPADAGAAQRAQRDHRAPGGAPRAARGRPAGRDAHRARQAPGRARPLDLRELVAAHGRGPPEPVRGARGGARGRAAGRRRCGSTATRRASRR